ncbi:Polynucleotidyl transferase, ribonuclease H fold [Aspergillus mulundensis]|uniref:Polynucleotidyl transferase, ribonuclease H fold n=1 Tax=Aspergillus mulundensis TaxID=1810919 RepID=A0A3D8SWJ3_9EURO|nr:Polynucleotidyl transferase, ribonuclease H fold [Aspergillus mulundensis]RDW90531.1 Polynucleotidyl transferase, ribonuclease H fold [Aspergillus mulundensis]
MSGHSLGGHPRANEVNGHVERSRYKDEEMATSPIVYCLLRLLKHYNVAFTFVLRSDVRKPSISDISIDTDRPTLEEIITKHPIRTSSLTVATSDITTLTECLGKTQLQDKPVTKLVSTPAEVSDMLKSLEDLPTSPPSLYIDLEGVNLSRHGTVSILQIYVWPHDKTYLVDIHTLKKEAFTTKSSASGTGSDTTLKSILESPSIPKVIFDVRNDSDALYAHFQINLAGIQDLQLMELATRGYSRRRVNGLAKCIEYDAAMTASERRKWKETKEKGVKLFAPEHGGSYEVFNERPLKDEIVEYCVQDVRFLPKLWQAYDRRLTAGWRTKIAVEVKNRIVLSQAATFVGKGKHMALAPTGWA